MNELKHAGYTQEDKDRVAAMVKECPSFYQFVKEYKCCYNCNNWNKDYTLMGDYEYNACLKTNPPLMTKCALHCGFYDGYSNYKDNPHPAYEIVEVGHE